MSKARLTLPLAPWGAASSLEGNDVRPLAASLRTAPYSHFVPHLCVMGFCLLLLLLLLLLVFSSRGLGLFSVSLMCTELTRSRHKRWRSPATHRSLFAFAAQLLRSCSNPLSLCFLFPSCPVRVSQPKVCLTSPFLGHLGRLGIIILWQVLSLLPHGTPGSMLK